jgi:predicted nucleic acid-binding protein
MVSGLLDTSVLIDLLRLHPPAQTWLHGQNTLGVTPIVWLEIIQGAQNKVSQVKAINLLKVFEQVELTSEDCAWAIQQATRFTLSHSVGSLDCLIASTSHRLNVPLYTGNLKHFKPMLGGLAHKPY